MILILPLYFIISCETKTDDKKNQTIVYTEKKNTPAILPIDQLEFYKKNKKLKLVCFIPSLYIDCDYASMLTTSLSYYFAEGLSFDEIKRPKIDVIMIVNDKNKWKNSKKHTNQNKLDKLSVYYDESGDIFKTLGVDTFDDSIVSSNSMDVMNPNYIQLTRNESAILYLLDENNQILHKDDNYRGEGENLRLLEKNIKKHLKINAPISSLKSTNLNIGQKAPDFNLNGPEIKKIKKLSETSNKIKIITFYPAPFTGTFISENYHVIENKSSKNMTCSTQLKTFAFDEYNDLIEVYAISSSTDEILTLWKDKLKSENITYLNDPDYTISKLYGSFNEKEKINNRNTYIIKDGVIRYIDEDFELDDYETLQIELSEIL